MTVEPQPLVSLRGICKSFSGVVANQDVDLDLYVGQTHALLGENGAGKSTLMNILAGLYSPDEGTILFDGRETTILTPRNAFDLGVGMVHQHFTLVDSFTAVENIVLGADGPALSLDIKVAASQLKAFSEQYGLEAPLDEPVGGLTVGQRQRIEILRLLYREAKIVIFDEPSAVLTPQEVDGLGAIVRRLCAEGRAVVYITHRLREALAFADTVSVLRGGRLVATLPVGQVDEARLVEMMIGERYAAPINPGGRKAGAEVLRVAAVCTNSDSGARALRGVDLSVQAGEVLGIAGVSGNGQTELAEVIAGLRPLTGGQVWLNGKDVSGSSARRMIDMGVAYVPGERMRRGMVAALTVAENLALKGYRGEGLRRGPFLDREKMARHSNEVIEEFDIKVPDPRMLAQSLSGGNQQKVILARELLEPHTLLVVETPTRGLDVKATAAIHRQLLLEREKGNAVLLISSDLDEVLALSDRIAVMYGGLVVGVLDARDASPFVIGDLMCGLQSPPISRGE
jgi:simple sugar transport system ATP-binding protein